MMYWEYMLWGILLSGILLVFVIVQELVMRRFHPYTDMLPWMFKRVDRRLTCYDVDITFGYRGYRVRSYTKWMMRVMLVSVVCYLWETLGIYSDMHRVTDESAAVVSERCSVGTDCYFHERRFYVSIFWILWSQIVPVCGRSVEELAKTDGYFTCVELRGFHAVSLATQCAVAMALTQLLNSFFQAMVWLHYRANSVRLIIFTAFASVILTLGIMITTTFLGGEFFASFTWFSTVVFVSLPLIIVLAVLASWNLVSISRDKKKALDATYNEPVRIKPGMKWAQHMDAIAYEISRRNEAH